MIALVYTGTLNGKRIIIKVLRKNIRARMEVALEKIDFLGKLIGRIPYIKALNLGDLIEENKLIMLSQTSLSTEVENIQIMFKNCQYTDYVIIPRVYPEYTNDDNSLIVMDYIDGRKLDEITCEDKETYCIQLAQFGIKCILYNRVYHGDLHPGNILFIKDELGNQRLGIIDFGIMGELTREEQNYYYNLLNIMNNSVDYIDVVTLILNKLVQPQQRVESLSTEMRNDMTNKLANIFYNACMVKRSIDTNDIYNITKILRAYNLTLAKSFCKIQLCMAVADSVIRKLSDSSTYLDNVKKVVSEMSIPI
jgi:predicted unusual protein kinase regulating ubiquinone biosynthesis (AarF/ABC1/UbiB family)